MMLRPGRELSRFSRFGHATKGNIAFMDEPEKSQKTEKQAGVHEHANHDDEHGRHPLSRSSKIFVTVMVDCLGDAGGLTAASERDRDFPGY